MIIYKLAYTVEMDEGYIRISKQKKKLKFWCLYCY